MYLQGASGWTVQDAQLDWGFFGDADETATCAGQNCAYTNPNSPYGELARSPAQPSSILKQGASSSKSGRQQASQARKQRPSMRVRPPPPPLCLCVSAGLTVLPLAPGQTLSSQLTKDLPDFVRQDYQQRNGLSAPARAVGSGFSLPGRGLRQEAGVETRAARAQGQGYSAAWQLAPDEVMGYVGQH